MKNALKKAISKSGLKTFEVARKANLHPSTVSHIANEHFSPSETHKEKIAKALGIPADKLFPHDDRGKEAVNV